MKQKADPNSKNSLRKAERKAAARLSRQFPIIHMVERQLGSAAVESRFIQPFEPDGVNEDGSISLEVDGIIYHLIVKEEAA